ncbi:glycosyltransferase [Marinifilum caeruleilacunae]|uniref:Glycosyltransferase n=1 Tax=Marinifilum caeruleilacunae TaxID=2499076 RepID=A0ABX1WR59_9BACT|nr:glycosyltransferase [Marinifilum caeruleilacunae]NOU58418.1 glycosyltransferase [Marinifilum caeruleilacunae]
MDPSKEKKQILIVNPGQFGYQSGYFYYCKYLKEEYHITFICYDQGFPKVELEGVEIHYLPIIQGKWKRFMSWRREILKLWQTGKYEKVFMVYFKLCFLLGLSIKKGSKILDIRSGSLKKSPVANFLQNQQILFESFFFDRITILSEKLREKIGFRKEKCNLLPLGADIIPSNGNDFSTLKLLYVGTLNKRNIHETIEGFAKFYHEFHSKVKVTYDIFGYGSSEDEKCVIETIEKNQLQNIVCFHGRVNHDQLKPYFKKCNVGVSYVPLEKYYDYQPPTKTFEYVLSGMICIATSTYENRRLINSKNGFLCEDNSTSFYDALKMAYHSKHSFDTEEIVKSLESYEWSNIVKSNLKPVLELS